MFSPDSKHSSMENYLVYLEKKRTRNYFLRDMYGERCSSEDAMLCLKAVESYARKGAHKELLNSISVSKNELEHILKTKNK